jgi:hypothetical protein
MATLNLTQDDLLKHFKYPKDIEMRTLTAYYELMECWGDVISIFKSTGADYMEIMWRGYGMWNCNFLTDYEYFDEEASEETLCHENENFSNLVHALLPDIVPPFWDTHKVSYLDASQHYNKIVGLYYEYWRTLVYNGSFDAFHLDERGY